jgi:ATP-binding cassette subfamily C protein CydCD
VTARDDGSPIEGIAEVGTRRLLLLGLLGALKALGLVLVADAVAAGIVTVIAHGDVTAAVIEGVAGAVLRAAAVWSLRVVSQGASAGVKRRLRARLARAHLGRPAGSVGADVSLAATGLDDLDAYYTSYLPALVGAATVPLLVGARILAADWVSAVVIVVTVPLIPFFMALIGMHTRDRVAASLDALGRLSDHLVELARGLPVLVGLGRDREQAEALRDISEAHRGRSMTALRTAFLSSLALDLTATISVALVAVIIGVRLLNGGLTLEAGLVALILAPECYAPLRDVGAAFHASDIGREALRRARAVFSGPSARQGPTRREAAGVVVHDLTVTYSGRSEPAIAGLSFRAPEGSITLLSGDSGAGKSTVLAMLAGRGAALDDGARCSGGVAEPPRTAIAWMPQHPHFSSRTVLDELELYADAGEDAVGGSTTDARSLLERVRLGHVAACDPAELSPGEARRLAFARVLAAVDAGARLVLLDEPTAHLDGVSAERIRREIARLRGRVTVIAASHDAAVRLLADRIVPVGAATGRSSAATRASVPNRGHAADAANVRDPGGDARIDAAPPESGRGAPSGTLTYPERRHDGRHPGEMRSALAELASFVLAVRWRILLAVLLGMLSSAFAVALTTVSGWLIVRAGQEPAIMYLLVAIVGVRFFGLGRSVLRYAERLVTHDAVLRATTALRLRLWASLAESGPAGRRALSAANALAMLVGAADRVRDLVPRVVQPPAAAALVVAGSAVTLGLLYPPAVAVIVVLAVIALLVAPAVAVAAGRLAARRAERSRAEIMTSFTDLLVARDDLTPLAADRLIARIETAGALAARGERRTSHAEGAASALVVLACCAAAVVMLPLAAAAVASGALRPELVAVLALVPLALTEPLLDGVAAASRAPALLGVLAQLTSGTRMRSGVDEASAGHGARLGVVDGIRLTDVEYRYPDARRPVFTGVDGAARRGEWLAVTGPSGSGKSTLLALLLRFADPTAGRYQVVESESGADGGADVRDARTLPPRILRTRVAWCPQEGHLFDSTLRANLVIARSRADAPSDDELVAALTRVGLGPLLTSLPDGLGTRIGPAGGRLSGGQRQRVAVARTLLTRGDVVLIDEPTAHLDEQASVALLADLRDALEDRTTVLVTHDLAEAHAAEHLIELGTPPARQGSADHTAASALEPVSSAA